MTVISAFGDEIATDLETQLKTLNELAIHHLEFRAAWGVNVLYLSDEQVAQVRQLCDDAGVTVSCIGSPLGKSPIEDPIEKELGNMRRILEVADQLGTKNIRIFSFYPPDTSTNAHYDQYVDEAADRLRQMVAAAEGFNLLLENEKEIVTDTPERCYAVLSQVEGLGFIWDPANFVQCGVADQIDLYWDNLSPFIQYIHIKDALLEGGKVTVAGAGDGQVKKLLTQLRDTGYDGVLALEPHLVVAGHSSGFSGVDGITQAVGALRGLLEEIGQPAM
ncbi:MAG: sugar phosphate isomerase/epimerase [Anaerolineae bacterium]|nr:sugar phosphate isomerase/epimerase [Anaerolineae bacterium]